MDPIVIESRLVAATVYGDLARVCREGHADLAAGTSRIAWPDLPAEVDPADVRVETDRGLIRAVETEPVPMAPVERPASAGDDLRLELQRIVARQEGLRAELELLDHVMPPRDATAASLRPDLFVKGLDAITERRRSALSELRRETAAYAEASRALERAEAAARERAPSHRQTLIVTVASDSAGPTRLRVTYASGWATWRPLYHLQLSQSSERVELVRYGDVWQDTGEDWSQVALRLSTAEPETGLRLPTVKPWILKVSSGLDDDMKTLYRRSERRRTLVDASMETLPEASAAETVAQVTVPPPAANVATIEVDGEFESPEDGFEQYATQFDENGVFAEVTSPGLAATRAPGIENATDFGAGVVVPPMRSPDAPLPRPPPAHAAPDRARLVREPQPREASGGIDVEIPVVRPFDARSGADRHRVQLGRRAYPLQLWYILRPGLRDHAFGRAEIINEEPDPILAGPTSLFVGGTFYGHTRLATTPGRGKLVLDLGAETGIKCARRNETQVRREGLLTKDEVHAVDVTIDVENALDVAAKIEVQDQVPIATDPQVRVRLLNTDPADAKLDEQTGLVTFSTQVGARSKVQLRLSYEVGAPAGFRLSQGLTDEVNL